ncbi:MAG TPA: hypothetical protein PLB89_16320 [Flavobacteriales bacterium]|nr:hypothetical protein [Flavobacteriales bacterium]
MRSFFYFLAFLHGIGQMLAQNLVPNPSFEDYTICPDGLAQTSNATGWTAFSGSPDYFNACSATSITGVPSNAFGYQAGFDGGAYVGGYTYRDESTARECVQAQLLAPLPPGVAVHLSMSVATGGFGANATTVRRASNGIGIRFSTHADPPGLLITNCKLPLFSGRS